MNSNKNRLAYGAMPNLIYQEMRQPKQFDNRLKKRPQFPQLKQNRIKRGSY